ncbi:hypothetical protein [Sphingomonas psychrotolerans]|uniref:Uncharacterized protein n=1 Tax=Sphingomonas psychrotolerans TaxID=1327635 RepID=A0A2K8MFD0_9SPHN|nr:hypothetical protein [Sphingomonas psychrotolerans]ATY32587.1 hypothetical protein CVN68_11885 [Sphingomonas psychrotolerans]
MIGRASIAAALVIGLVAPSAAQDGPSYDFRERTRALAFNPLLFFPERSEPTMSVRYLGDDYGFPVYAIAVRRGCTEVDQGEARRTCGERLVARMVRAPFEGVPPRPRARGQRLFAAIAQAKPQSDDALIRLLDKSGLEWLEADVRKCPTAMAHLATGRDLKFSSAINQTDQPPEIVLHADTVAFEIGEYLTRSRYEGWLKPGSPGEWANDFAASLETCWRPSTAVVPWRVVKK